MLEIEPEYWTVDEAQQSEDAFYRANPDWTRLQDMKASDTMLGRTSGNYLPRGPYVLRVFDFSKGYKDRVNEGWYMRHEDEICMYGESSWRPTPQDQETVDQVVERLWEVHRQGTDAFRGSATSPPLASVSIAVRNR